VAAATKPLSFVLASVGQGAMSWTATRALTLKTAACEGARSLALRCDFLADSGFRRSGPSVEVAGHALIVYLTIKIIFVGSMARFVTSSPHDTHDHDWI
jgi:hypothetical protein